jgi:hypothetical protein
LEDLRVDRGRVRRRLDLLLQRDGDVDEARVPALRAGQVRGAAEGENDPHRKAVLEHDIEQQTRVQMTKCILSDKEHFARVSAKYSQIWYLVGRAATDLVSGRVIAAGKGAGA